MAKIIIETKMDKLPKSCSECNLAYIACANEPSYCNITGVTLVFGYGIYETERHRDCPLKEV